MMWKRFVQWAMIAGMLLASSDVAGQSTLKHAAKVQIQPNGSTTYSDTFRIWGGLQAGAGGLVQVINADGTINGAQIPAGSITFSMWDDNGCSSGQIPKYNGSAWVCDTDITATGSGTLGSISLVMPSAVFDISPGTLTADGTFTVTFDTQSANTVLAGPTTGSAAAPTFRALVAADLPSAVVQSSDNELITGDWRFQEPTVFGDSITPQQLIHIYKGSAQAGLTLEKGDETERWDILANTSGLQITEATSGNSLLTFKSNRIGLLTSTPAAGYELDINGDLKVSGNINLGSYFENSLIPSTGDTYNLGDVTRPWSQGYISTINATVFAEATATIFGGYSIIGRNSGTLAAAAASGDTTIYLDKDGTSLPVSGDTWIVIRAHDSSGSVTPKTEYIKLVSVGSCTGTAPNLSCPWSVLRDQASAHGTDPAWPIGTPFLFLGSNGDGRIELNAVSGLPRISILRQSTTATTSTDIIRLGGLDGVAGMSSVTGRYGIFIGEGTTNYLKFQKNVGGGAAVGDDDTLIVGGTIKAIAGEFGSNASNLVQVSSEGLNVNTGAVHGGKTSYASSTDGFWIGNDAGSYKVSIGDGSNYLTWDGVSTLTIAGNGAGLTSINGGNIQTDSITATQIAADAVTASEIVGTTLSAISADLGTITAGTITGATLRTATSGSRVEINSTSGLVGYDSGGTAQVTLSNTTGKLTAAGGIVTLDSSGIGVNISTSGAAVAANSYRFLNSNAAGNGVNIQAYENTTTKTRYLYLVNDTTDTTWTSNISLYTTNASTNSASLLLSTDGDLGEGIAVLHGTETLRVYADSVGRLEMVGTKITFDDFTNPILVLDTTNLRTGVGTSSPLTDFHINTSATNLTAAAPSLITALSASNNTQHDLLQFNVGADATHGALVMRFAAYPSATGSSRYGAIYVADNSAFRNLILNPVAGSVGINDTTPSYTLDVNGTINSASGYYANGTAGIDGSFNPTTCTNLTFVKGILTSKTGC